MKRQPWVPGVRLDDANTFGLVAEAEYGCQPATVPALQETLAAARQHGLMSWVLGGGSNLLLGPKLSGLCIRPAIRGLRMVEDDGEQVTVDVGAGENWHDLVRFAIGQGWSGIENLALIPGTVGAAPMQNIGAYAAEVADVAVGVHVMRCEDLSTAFLPASACDFSYRSSLFKGAGRGQYLITGLRLRLSRHFVPQVGYPDVALELQRLGCPSPVHPAQVAEAVIRIRRRKLPDWRHQGNAGSFFQNPVISRGHFQSLKQEIPDLPGFDSDSGIKIPAARLIDLAGWKGQREGAIMVWPRQPLVLVNTGGGRASEVVMLARRIVADLEARFAVRLVAEVQPVGLPDAIDLIK